LDFVEKLEVEYEYDDEDGMFGCKELSLFCLDNASIYFAQYRMKLMRNIS